MSDIQSPEPNPFYELDALVRHMADELAGFRRRALLAEARLKEVEANEGGAASLDLIARVAHLEQENEKLNGRLDTAGTRARQMLDRVRFLRQQTQGGER
ncbi:MAG: hypothetical protein ABI442_15380 [Gemmatimonadaceae bacterium]